MSGICRRNLNTQAGCDSVVELFLMVMSDTLYTDSKTICEGETPYLWNGQSITASGVYNATVNSSLGCDSLVELTLTILPEYHDADQVTISQLDLPYTYNGMVFDENTTVGVHTQIFRDNTEAGWDSTLTLTSNVQQAS